MPSIADSLARPQAGWGRGAVLLVRTAGVALVVALPLVVLPWGIDAYSSIKGTLMYALTVTVLLGWAGAYVTIRQPKWKPTGPEMALWAYLLALLASSATSVSPLRTFLGGPLRHEGLLAVGCYVALYFAGVHFFGSSRGTRSLLLSAAIAALFTIGYALLQPFVPPLFAGEAFTREQYGGLGALRVLSTVGGPVVFGGYLAFMLPLLAALASSSLGRRRLPWLLGAGGAVVVLVLTLTRAAWLAALVGVGLFMAGAGEARRDRQVTAVLLGAVVLGAVVLLTAVTTPALLTTRVASAVDTRSGSLAQHIYLWERTLGLVRARPVLGWGLETLREVFPYNREELVRYFGRTPVIIDRAHNDVLQMAVSIGIPGAAAYVTFWILVLTASARLAARMTGGDRIASAGGLAAVAAYLVQVQFSFSTVNVTPIVWLLAGALSGWSTQARAAGR
ncbi:MAG TPA: O-antigen ligase family protein [bacterium]|nr:O-antigen ligase family protein [bacterium]